MSVDVTGDVIVLICIVVVDVINVFQHLVLHSVGLTIPVSRKTNVSTLVKTAGRNQNHTVGALAHA